ncbi:MAG: MmcQ/YjbR family DNA-binding protein [Rhizobiaceae bacterium]
MTLEEYNAFCASLAHTAHVVQWGGAHVWKVGGPGGKVFAVGGWSDEPLPYVTFKCSPISFEMLKEQPGLRPAPYLASRGMLWIQRYSDESMGDLALKDYLRESHRLASLNLPKSLQKTFGLNQ